MKKLWILPMIGLLLAGCGSQETLETVNDIYISPTMATVQQVYVELPKELEAPVFQDESNGKLYLCDDYSVAIQTVEAGDLQKSVFTVAGLPIDEVQIIETQRNDCTRYEFVWTANAETGLHVGRCCILDDGNYHYAISAMAQEEAAGRVQETWDEMFQSFRLVSGSMELNTGS